ncbi:MAG: hypothetical protein WBV53_12720, partial [Solirubrobacterales bacterium]
AAPVGPPEEGGSPSDGGDGKAPTGGNGSAEGERPELSEASAAALRRVREQSGGRKQKRRRKHGRNR